MTLFTTKLRTCQPDLVQESTHITLMSIIPAAWWEEDKVWLDSQH